MTIEEGELLKILITAASVTYSVIFGIVAKKVWDVPKTIEAKLEEFERTLSGRINNIEADTELVSKRVDVHDRISSKVIGKDFDSHSIVQSGAFPEIPHVR